MSEVLEEDLVRVDWLMLADAAQLVGGKLYALGGGWSALTVNSVLPVDQRFSIAVAFSIPWGQTNVRHPWQLAVQDEDRHTLVDITGELLAGRPPNLPTGQPQRTQFTFDVTIRFEHLGTYSVVASVSGREAQRTPFLLMAGPGQPPRPRAAGEGP